jgi:hypothetical protein
MSYRWFKGYSNKYFWVSAQEMVFVVSNYVFMADHDSILFLNTLDLLGTAEGYKQDAVGTVGGKKVADRSAVVYPFFRQPSWNCGAGDTGCVMAKRHTLDRDTLIIKQHTVGFRNVYFQSWRSYFLRSCFTSHF